MSYLQRYLYIDDHKNEVSKEDIIGQDLTVYILKLIAVFTLRANE